MVLVRSVVRIENVSVLGVLYLVFPWWGWVGCGSGIDLVMVVVVVMERKPYISRYSSINYIPAPVYTYWI